MAMGKIPGERQEELFIAASGVGALGPVLRGIGQAAAQEPL